MKGEIWKSIDGYIGLYEVSNKGRIKSLNRITKRTNTSTRKLKSVILKNQKCTNGYLFVALSKDGIRRQFLVHRLVAIAFIPTNIEGLDINHIDENKTNNNVTNLEWISHKENSVYGTKIERAKQKLNVKGEKNPMFGKRGILNKNSIPIDQYLKDGTFVKSHISATEISREYGYNASSILRTAKGYLKQAYGFVWRYKNNNKNLIIK